MSAFNVTVVGSGRPVFITDASVSTNTIILYPFTNIVGDLDAITGTAFNVTYAKPPGVSGAGVLEGGVDLPSFVCLTTVDLVQPLLIRAIRDNGTSGILTLFFSEPVKACPSSTNFSKTDLTTTGTITLTSDPVGLNGTLSNVWILNFTNSSDTASLTVSVSTRVCDSSGNTILSIAVPVVSNKEIAGFARFLTASSKYYDMNLDGKVDAVLAVANFPFDTTLINSSSLNISVNGIAISNPSYWTEGSRYDNKIFVKFDGVTLVSTSSPPTISNPTNFSIYISNSTQYAVGLVTQLTNDFAPAVILSATSTVGSKTLTVTMSEAHSTTLTTSRFSFVFANSNSVASGSGTSSTITITLANALQLSDFVPTPSRIYQINGFVYRSTGTRPNYVLSTWTNAAFDSPTKAVNCFACGNAGPAFNLIQNVTLQFIGNLTNSYTHDQLLAALQVSLVSSDRPIPVKRISIDYTNNTIVLELKQFDRIWPSSNSLYNHDTPGSRYRSFDFDAQTGLALAVKYTKLQDVNGTGLQHRGLDPTTVICGSVIDKVSPVLMFANVGYDKLTTGNVSLFFSEPVKVCNSTRFSRSNINVTGGNFTLTSDPVGLDGGLSSVWTLGFSGANLQYEDVFIALNSTVMCDSVNNTILINGVQSVPVTTVDARGCFQPFVASYGKYYDINLDGKVDAVLIVSNYPFTNPFVNSTSVRISVNNVTVSVLAYVTEDFAFDNSMLVKFTGVLLANISAPPLVYVQPNFQVRIYSTPESALGYDATGIYPQLGDLAPAVVLTATSNVGINRAIVTLSEPHSSALDASQFSITFMNPNQVTSFTSNAQQINLTLANPVQFFDFSPIKARFRLNANEPIRAGGGVTDNFFPTPWKSTFLTDVDKATVVSIEARNSRLNGPHQDQFFIVFSEDMRASTVITSAFTIVSTSRVFTVTGVSVSTPSTSMVLVDATFVQCASGFTTCYNTADDFNLLISGLLDAAGIAMGSYSSVSSGGVTDRASPVLITAIAVAGTPVVFLTFSESIAPGFNASAFTLTLNDGPGS